MKRQKDKKKVRKKDKGPKRKFDIVISGQFGTLAMFKSKSSN